MGGPACRAPVPSLGSPGPGVEVEGAFPFPLDTPAALVLEGRLGLTRSVPAGILTGACFWGLLWGQGLWDTRTMNSSAVTSPQGAGAAGSSRPPW